MIHGNLPCVLNRISCSMQWNIHSIPKIWASFGDNKVLGIHHLCHEKTDRQDVCLFFSKLLADCGGRI